MKTSAITSRLASVAMLVASPAIAQSRDDLRQLRIQQEQFQAQQRLEASKATSERQGTHRTPFRAFPGRSQGQPRRARVTPPASPEAFRP
jgi:hypothetical protein